MQATKHVWLNHHLKILFFLHSPNPFPGAQWRRIEFFAEFFESRGHEVSVVGAFSYMSMRKAGLTRIRGIRLLNITPIIMMTNIVSLIFNMVSSFFASIIPLLWLRPDIVIISVPVGETAFGPFVGTKLFRTKRVVLDYRDEWEDYAIKMAKSRIHRKVCESLKILMTKFYSKTYFVMTTTSAMAGDLSSRGLNNVKVVTNGADTHIFKPHDKNRVRSKIGLGLSDFIIVYSGGLGGYYRLDLVIKALEKITFEKDNVRLVIIGRGQAGISNIINQASQVGLKENVLFLGAKSDKNEIAEILSAADVGIIPYDRNPLWKNTLPVKSLEYLACGLPIIATTYKDSVLGKLIHENQVGVISDPENVESLVVSIEKMYHDTAFLEEAGKRAVSIIEKSFDRNKIAEEVYNQLLESMRQ